MFRLFVSVDLTSSRAASISLDASSETGASSSTASDAKAVTDVILPPLLLY